MRPPRAEELLPRGAKRVLVDDVGGDRHRVGAVRMECRGLLLGARRRPAEDCDLRPGLGECVGHRAAEDTCTPGDDGDASCQVE